MKKEKLKREIVFTPAFDKRNDDPKKNYGIHGVEMRWYVKGKKGAVQFVLYTNWQLPEINAETFGSITDIEPSKFNHHSRVLCQPMAADVGYHSPKPMYEGHEPMQKTKLTFNKDNPLKSKFKKVGKPYICHLLGVPCYYDGSGMHAEKVFEILVRQGGDKVWEYLENYYYDTFDERRRRQKEAQTTALLQGQGVNGRKGRRK